MEPAWLQPRMQSQLLLQSGGSSTKSPKASRELFTAVLSVTTLYEVWVSLLYGKLVSLCNPAWLEYVFKPLILSNFKQGWITLPRGLRLSFWHVSFEKTPYVLNCIFSHRQTPVQTWACTVPLSLRRWNLPPEKWHVWCHIKGNCSTAESSLISITFYRPITEITYICLFVLFISGCSALLPPSQPLHSCHQVGTHFLFQSIANHPGGAPVAYCSIWLLLLKIALPQSNHSGGEKYHGELWAHCS